MAIAPAMCARSEVPMMKFDPRPSRVKFPLHSVRPIHRDIASLWEDLRPSFDDNDDDEVPQGTVDDMSDT